MWAVQYRASFSLGKMMSLNNTAALGRRKYYSIGRGVTDVGERKWGFDGCNALEFRTTGYCLRHKDGEPSQEVFTLERRSSEVKGSLKESAGVLLIILGILPSLIGIQLFLGSFGLIETTNNPFEFVAALFFLGIGVPMLVFGFLLVSKNVWYGLEMLPVHGFNHSIVSLSKREA